MADWKNKLYFGDNLGILREHVPDESVDLIYLDPPFNSNATYNVLFREASGEGSAAQIHAFDDTWHWNIESERAYREVVTNGPKKLADLLQAMRSFLGQNDMMAYLTMMASAWWNCTASSSRPAASTSTATPPPVTTSNCSWTRYSGQSVSGTKSPGVERRRIAIHPASGPTPTQYCSTRRASSGHGTLNIRTTRPGMKRAFALKIPTDAFGLTTI